MPLTILYPDSRFERLDVEQELAGRDTVFINPRKRSFGEIDLKAWESADAVVTSRVGVCAPWPQRCRRLMLGSPSGD